MRKHPCYSSLSTYLRCPAAFRACYINEDPGLSGDAVDTGKLAHEAMARYGAHCYKRKRATDFDEAQSILTGYPAEVQSLLEDFLSNWRWEWGTVIVENAAPVEQRLTALLPSGQQFSGHLDLLQKYDDAANSTGTVFGDDDADDSGDGALWVVTDFASHWYDKRKQLEWYAFLVQSNHPGARVIEGRVQPFCTFGYQGEPVRFEGDLAHVGKELQTLCDRIAADEEFEPRPGAACARCFHRLSCPCKDTATLDAICGDTPEGWLRKKLWHDAQGDALTSLLKPYAQENGCVAIPGYCYEGRAAEKLIVKSPATLEIDLQAFDLKPSDLTNGPTKAQVDKVGKKLPAEQREAFDALFEIKPGSVTYKAYNSTEGDDTND